MTIPNGNFDPIAQWARLSERVENQGKDIVDLRSNMNTRFQNIQSGLSSLSNELRGSSRTQWPVIFSAAGLAVTVIIAVGTLTIMPIRDTQSIFSADLKALASTTVTHQEMDWRAQRGVEDRNRTDNAVADLRASTITRNEWTERNRARDQEVLDLNRRVDEIRQDVGAVYGTRDVIQDMKKEIDRLRQRQVDMRSGAPPSD